MKLTLRELRKANKISQKQAAEMFGVSQDSIARWEKGETYPSAIQILEICKSYKCSFEDIDWKPSK